MVKEKGKVPEGGADFINRSLPYSFSPVGSRKQTEGLNLSLAWLGFGLAAGLLHASLPSLFIPQLVP
jgi:hypothetical protein